MPDLPFILKIACRVVDAKNKIIFSYCMFEDLATLCIKFRNLEELGDDHWKLVHHDGHSNHLCN